MRYKRNPPNFRKPDCCSKCRAFKNECTFYEFKSYNPDDEVCDDFRGENW